MSAPTGNQFWKLASKHGRDTLFTSPELLWEAACEYFEWAENNPLMAQEQRKGNIIIAKGVDTSELDLSPMVEIPKMRAFTLENLCSYLGCNTAYFRNFKIVDKEREQEFSAVFTRIQETIRNQKFIGAAAGFLNPMIIARDLGLRDHIDQKNENINLNIEPTPEEAQRIKESLDKSI